MTRPEGFAHRLERGEQRPVRSHGERGGCIGWVYRTLGGFYRYGSILGHSSGPYFSETEAEAEVVGAWKRWGTK